MNKNTLIGLGIVVVIVIIGAIGLSYYGSNHRNNYSNDGTSAVPIPTPNQNPTGGTSGTSGTQPPVATQPPVVTPPPAQTPPPSGGVAGPIAYIGCSNTWQIVGGYHDDGGTKFWAADSNYGGGTAVQWGSRLTNSNPYWAEFDKLNAQDPGAKTLWVMVCIKGFETYDQSYADEVAAINEAKRRIPTIQNVYATALSEYPDHVCSETKTTGVPNAEHVVSQLAASGIANRGPVLSPLTQAETTDGCHPNPQLRLTLGNELVSFFGK